MNKIRRYTTQEDAVILRVFPVDGYEGVMKALPKRTFESIKSHISDMRDKGITLINPACADRPIKAQEERTRKRRVSMAGMSRHERYMRGEVGNENTVA